VPYSAFTTNGADIALAILNGILLLIISSTGAGFFSSRIRNIDVKLTFFDLIKFFNLIIFGNLELPFQASSGTIMTMVYLVFSLAIPFFLYNQAMRHIPVGMASLFLVLVIPLGFFFAAIFMGEEITLLKITGAVLVMIGVVLPHLLQIGIKRYSI